MKSFRVEILGSVPRGLTHNDVYASTVSILNEYATGVLVTKRRLSNNMISMIATFEADNLVAARTAVSKVTYGISGFAADTFGFREIG